MAAFLRGAFATASPHVRDATARLPEGTNDQNLWICLGEVA
jgi:hypothetical protein